MSVLFKGTSPCASCPYRKDAPLKLWSKEEFEDLLKSDKDIIGKVYGCHKNDQTICRGWLIDQDKRNFPSNALRFQLMQNNIGRNYLDKLKSKYELFLSIEHMCHTNYPEVFEKPNK